MSLMEEFIRGLAFGIAFTIISLLGDWIKANLKKRKPRVKKAAILKLVRNK